MSSNPSIPRTVSTTSRPALWFGFLGGAVAWTVHFMAAYAIAEFGCVGTLKSFTFAGLHGVAWLVLIVSIAMTLVAAGATLVSWRGFRRLDDAPDVAVERYLAKAGAIASGVFLFIIIVETIPIFFYLRHC